MTKFLIPPIPRDDVQRPRLIQKINQGVDDKLVLISAPAGFGKSTLAAQWQSQTDLPVAWVTLDRGDNNPTTFINSLLNAILLGQEPATEYASGLPRILSPRSIEEAELQLHGSLAGNQAELVIVLDDYHHVETQAIHQRLFDAIGAASPQIHFIIISRTRPPFSINSFRVRRQLVDLDPDDLRFNHDEIRDFFLKTNRIQLSEEELYNLMHRSEGWAACLQLASLSMQDLSPTEVREYIDHFTSSNRFVWDYLIEEVYSKQPEHIQEFMQQTSILRRLSPALCDEVSGRSDSRQILAYLDSTHLISPLEDKRRWYRYPALIADFLYEMMEQKRGIPGTFDLHRRAARWYESIGELGEAAHHAYASLDTDYANLLLNRIQSTINLRDYAGWQYSFLDLPDEVLQMQPEACYSCAVSLMLSNDLENFERPMRIAEQVWKATGNKSKLGLVYYIRAIIKRYEDDYLETIRLTEQALELLPENERLARSGAEHILGMAQFQLGRAALAEAMLPEAIRGLRETGENYSADMGLAGLARVQMARGKLRQAEETYQTVIAFTDGKVFDQVLSGHVFLGTIYYEWNRLDLAEKHLLKAFAEPGGRTGRYWPLAHIYLALIHFERGDLQKAAAALEDAFRAGEKLKKLGWRRMVRDFQAWLAIRTGDLQAAQSWFTELEPLTDDDLADYRRFHDWLVMVRLLIAQGRSRRDSALLQEAVRLVDLLYAHAESDGRGLDQVRLLTIRAIALWNHGEHRSALTTLGQAFALAEPEGLLRTFLDENQGFADLLAAALAQDVHSRYAGRLQAEYHPASELYISVGNASHASGLLSPRELEILQSIAEGTTTQEIAERFCLSPFTVRTHIKRLFEKLDVHSRLQAVEHARRLGIL